MLYRTRTLEQAFLKANRQFPAVLVTGPRQVGKTSLLRHLGSFGTFIPSRGLLERAGADESLTLGGLYQQIWRGSLPGLHGELEVDRDLFLSSYVQTYLQRDIRDLAHVGNELTFLRFLKATAARTGQLLNMADLSRDSDISQVTAKHWLSILVASGLVYLLAPWHSNLTKRLVKTPKLYFLDTGLATWLTSWSSAVTLEAGAMSGAILETWVVSELVRGWWHQGKEAPLYFYRDKDQKEIDVLIHWDGKLHPLEIKKSAQPGSDATRHFSSVETLGEGRGEGAVLCLTPSWLPFSGQDSLVGVGLL